MQIRDQILKSVPGYTSGQFQATRQVRCEDRVTCESPFIGSLRSVIRLKWFRINRMGKTFIQSRHKLRQPLNDAAIGRRISEVSWQISYTSEIPDPVISLVRVATRLV